MQGVPRKKELVFQLWGPTRLNEFKIEGFIRPVDFVADDGMT